MNTIDDKKAAWLTERTTAIGASESPALFGCGFVTPYVLWCRKLGLLPPADETEPMEVGTLMQPVIAELLRRRTDFEVRECFTEFVRMEGRPHVGCSPDCYLFSEERGLGVGELKNVGQYLSAEWDGDVPLRTQVQIQHQLAVTGLSWGLGAGLVGGNRLKWHLVERDERFIAELLKRCDLFWKQVTERTPPDVDGDEQTTAALFAVHPNDNGETVQLGDSFLEVANELDALNRIIADAESRRDELQNHVRAALGDNTFGVMSNGAGWSWKTQARKAYQVNESTSRVLRKTKGKKQ